MARWLYGRRVEAWVDPRFITVDHAEEDVRELLLDLFVSPREAVRKWSERTNQTTQAKTAYLGQHLASVVTGVPGEGTAARGNDLVDGSEVKSCSRADQLGVCKSCGRPVLPWQEVCGTCGSPDVLRKTDSHWIIAIRSKAEVTSLLEETPRVVLVLLDRTKGPHHVRVRAWEVWPRLGRHAYFRDFVTNYFEKNFSVKRERAAPANFHPLKFDFYMSNPVKTLDARLLHADDVHRAEVEIDLHVASEADRAQLTVEPMPVSACRPHELRALLAGANLTDFESALLPEKTLDDLGKAGSHERRLVAHVSDVLTEIPERVRSQIKMREKRIKMSPSTYQRRRASPG